MSKSNKDCITELPTAHFGTACTHSRTPLGMRISTEDLLGGQVAYYGVVKNGENLALLYAAVSPTRQEALPLVMASMITSFLANDPSVTLKDSSLSSDQVCALTGYHNGFTVVCDVDRQEARVYTTEHPDQYCPPETSGNEFYDQEFCAICCASKIPLLDLVETYSFAEIATFSNN